MIIGGATVGKGAYHVASSIAPLYNAHQNKRARLSSESQANNGITSNELLRAIANNTSGRSSGVAHAAQKLIREPLA